MSVVADEDKGPMRRRGYATEVAEALAWLCSDKSFLRHGTLIDIAGAKGNERSLRDEDGDGNRRRVGENGLLRPMVPHLRAYDRGSTWLRRRSLDKRRRICITWITDSDTAPRKAGDRRQIGQTSFGNRWARDDRPRGSIKVFHQGLGNG